MILHKTLFAFFSIINRRLAVHHLHCQTHSCALHFWHFFHSSVVEYEAVTTCYYREKTLLWRMFLNLGWPNCILRDETWMTKPIYSMILSKKHNLHFRNICILSYRLILHSKNPLCFIHWRVCFLFYSSVVEGSGDDVAASIINNVQKETSLPQNDPQYPPNQQRWHFPVPITDKTKIHNQGILLSNNPLVRVEATHRNHGEADKNHIVQCGQGIQAP